ncbi:hypothetical protein [Lysobacter solisilvae (ex Woo and Kim 2020)]|uniref:Uncharacterized protein n=1 Tax=Agrilutibacter terrestris TaxID=2865112 RepID=A0A7H0FVH0_9GAMM|nr:hypothetical protein [Lysobacter terrestris]QNP40036.1 hypothetical protein H8B22_11070 [Lysobacter terrestris]
MNIFRIGLALLLSFSFQQAALAAESAALAPASVKVNDLTQDLQRSSQSIDSLDLIWWIPAEFWDVALANEQGMDEKTRRGFSDLFRTYTVVAAVKGQIGALGATSFESEADLRAKLQVLDAAGKAYRPIAADKLDRQLSLLIQVMRPMFKNLLGEMGDNLQFYAFPGKGGDGRRLADPLGNGTFKVGLGDETYSYRLPLGSLLVPRRDPGTGEVFPGSYRFNPYTGTELQAEAP